MIVKLLVIAICSWLYSRGGYSRKWLRRYVSPILMVGTICLFTQNLLILIQTPLMMATLSMGYGGDNFKEKLFRRSLWGFANGIASSPSLAIEGQWFLIVLQVVFVTTISILLGVYNPFKSARREETAIGATIYSLPLIAA